LHARLQYSCCLVSLVASTHFTTAMAGSLSLSWSVARSLLIAARRLKRPRQLPHARETSRAMRRTGRTSGCRWPCGASLPRAPRGSPDSPPPSASAIDSSIALRSCVSSSSSSSPPYSPPPPLPPDCSISSSAFRVTIIIWKQLKSTMDRIARMAALSTSGVPMCSRHEPCGAAGPSGLGRGCRPAALAWDARTEGRERWRWTYGRTSSGWSRTASGAPSAEPIVRA
jgi:hypothetical protein